jgi:hypothetical protein
LEAAQTTNSLGDQVITEPKDTRMPIGPSSGPIVLKGPHELPTEHISHPQRLCKSSLDILSAGVAILAGSCCSQPTNNDITKVTSPTTLKMTRTLFDELIYQIVTSFVPDGLRLSNDPDTESDLSTIRAVLKTSRVTRDAMLLRLFKYPLHIHLRSGKRCGCRGGEKHRDSRLTPILATIFKHKTGSLEPFLATDLIEDLSSLPLQKWPSNTVHLAPSIEEAYQCL